MNRAIFLDRDGTIIEDRGYICHLTQSEIFPFTLPAVRLMNEHLFKVVVITNQASIAKGICSKEEVEILHQEIKTELNRKGGKISRFYYSPYHKDGIIPEYSRDSVFRKPAPGMILEAVKDFNINLAASYMMGDSLVDIQAGANAGCKTVLVLTGKGKKTLESLNSSDVSPDFIAENILTAFEEIILREGIKG
jgi:D,D-heptose 1,7-bisphosphate phosphatase